MTNEVENSTNSDTKGESTRFKTLEEQIKKQEIKLQEVVEGLQASHHQQLQICNELCTELEENNKRMKGLVVGMKQEFSAFMKMMMGRDNAIPKENW